MKTKKLIIVAGATGIGKTNLVIRLAQKFKSEILSADSRQFYKELNIGVAKPTKKQLNDIKHHFIGHISIQENYSVGQYEKDGLKLLNQLFKKNDILFLCGGSGLYIDALCEGLNIFPDIKNNIKIRTTKDLKEKGINHLIKELKIVDKNTYDIIDKKNPRRIIRALEVYRSTGIPFSNYKLTKKKKRDFQTLFISLNYNRDLLYQKINKRTEKMINDGLIDEVKSLYKFKDLKALQTIGYKEVFKYLDGEYDLKKTVEEIKKNTRRYAKRQITWFKKIKYQQYKPTDEEKIIELINNYF